MLYVYVWTMLRAQSVHVCVSVREIEKLISERGMWPVESVVCTLWCVEGGGGWVCKAKQTQSGLKAKGAFWFNEWLPAHLG